MKPPGDMLRRMRCMGTTTGVLTFPGLRPNGGASLQPKVASNTRVDYQSTPEGALVRRAQEGDEAAFREILEHYQSKVFSIIHGIVRHRNDTEDIAQQVFAKVYFSIRKFDFRSSLITWIYKITVNECYDYLRKKKVRKLVYESDLSEDEGHSVEELAEQTGMNENTIKVKLFRARQKLVKAAQRFERAPGLTAG